MGFFDLFRRGKPGDGKLAMDPKLMLKIREWLVSSSLVDMRKYLEQHPELLQDTTERFFETVIARGQTDEPALAEAAQKVRDELEIIRYARAHGGTRQAIRDAYIEVMNPFEALEIPPWLEAVRTSMKQGMTRNDLISHLRAAIQRARQDRDVASEVVAALEGMVAGLMMQEHMQERTQETLPESIELLEHALGAFPAGRFPKKHAEYQRMLGMICYVSGRERDDADMLNKAVTCLKTAGGQKLRAEEPAAWATLQMSIADAYARLERPVCAKKYLTMALEVLTRQSHPQLYGHIEEELERVEMSLLQMEEMLKLYAQVQDPPMIAGLRAHLHLDDKDC